MGLSRKEGWLWVTIYIWYRLALDYGVYHHHYHSAITPYLIALILYAFLTLVTGIRRKQDAIARQERENESGFEY